MAKNTLTCLPFKICNDIFYEMALDEILLRETIKTQNGYIRLYTLSKKSQTVGYFHKIKKSKRSFNFPYTRRITGGGIVQHGSDIVISFSFKQINTARNISVYYENIHDLIFKILRKYSINEEFFMAGHKIDSNRPDTCFHSPVKSDIILKGKKIAGGALCRKKNTFLYQGSLQYPKLMRDTNLLNSFRYDFIQSIAAEFDFMINESDIDQGIKEAAVKLSENKYKAIQWKRKF